MYFSSHTTHPENKMDDAAQYIYGSAYADDFLLHNPESLPRFAPLSRKALLYYAGDRYDPHKHGMTVELFIREIIKEIVSYKILYRTQAYDWEWIDQTLRKAIGGCLNIDLPYNQSRIDAGFKPGSSATRLISELLPN